jgi:aryl-alcohol dehydrogenase-like predicted oxidoreductase
MLGNVIEKLNVRRDVIIATKVLTHTPRSKLSSAAEAEETFLKLTEESLKRLKTDYIDLLWNHIYDYTTPMDEMLRALDDLVRQGKILYAGASNFPAWWLARANTLADFHGATPFIATQLEYSITERSCEPEFLPMAHEMDIGLVSWSPLGGGMATGKYNRGALDPQQLYQAIEDFAPRGPASKD